MFAIALFVALAAGSGPAVSVPAEIRLKDGTVYELKEPPRMSGTRFVFQTRSGKVFSLAESEVEEIRLVPPSPPGPPAINKLDPRQLGAYARQERDRKHVSTLIAPAATPKARKPPPS